MSTGQKEEHQFNKQNYLILIIGVVAVVVGFLLMVGGGSDDRMVYNPEIFSAQRITVAPTMVLLGYAMVMYGILRKPKSE